MSDNEYELKVLLELRERARDEAQDAYTEQLQVQHTREREAQDARQRLREFHEDAARQRASFDEKVRGGEVGIAQLAMFEDYQRGQRAHAAELEAAIKRADAAVAAQRQQVERAQQALTDADTQLEAVLSHQAAWQRERDHERQRKEEAAMDDVAARLWKENRR